MLLKTTREFLIVSTALAGFATATSTLPAAAFSVEISPSTSSFADGVQYAAHRRASGGPGCGYGGAFPCSSSEWGTCDDGYGGTVFPCSRSGRVRRGGF
jgi:hypothetical protein